MRVILEEIVIGGGVIGGWRSVEEVSSEITGSPTTSTGKEEDEEE